MRDVEKGAEMSTANNQPARLLTINTGSSSLKAARYQMASAEHRERAIQIERIGADDARMRIIGTDGSALLDTQQDLPNHAAALHALFDWLKAHEDQGTFDAVGHRVVHGGVHYRESQRITAELVSALQQLTAIDPDHLPQALDAIRTVGEAYPNVPQVACFDTAFHRRMPPVARRYALPREYADAGVIRYGFHGLSYEYIMQALGAADRAAAAGRVIIAHLGNGASMAAVHGGVSIDTTMGFTPTGGLVMGTRSGDLDPSVVLYLLHSRGMTPDDARAAQHTSRDARRFRDERGFQQDIRAITRELTYVRQQKARREWQEKWPAYGNVPPVNDYLTAKPEKKEEAYTPPLYVRVNIDPRAQSE